MSNSEQACAVYKRCGCADPATGKRRGSKCPRLAAAEHGSWYFAIQTTAVSGRRERMRRGGYATAEDAREAGESLRAAHREAPMTHGCTVAQWLRYWTALIQHRLRPSTFKAYRDHVRLYLLPHLGDIELSALSRRDVTRMFAELAGRRNRYGKPVSPATLERIRSTLRAALNEAFREDLIKDNPARALRLPSPRHPHAVVWTARRVAAWQETGERPPVAV
ncbi:tyrosine recombinase XerC [Nonomuraea sp. NPDC050328]|uniref:tyrosine recombinase XerC n=1 Tax=Nonomuraea sp. NPDC050328 TaxID=3364361 RepID=UPI0037915484